MSAPRPPASLPGVPHAAGALPAGAGSGADCESHAVAIRIGHAQLPGDLVLPQRPRALVIFAHGSGSSRHSRRNRAVAATLNRHGYATLLFDLLLPAEDADPAARFDIGLLAARLAAAVAHCRREPALARLPVVLFGASTGAAAALAVAAGGGIAAVVSRGGRPDLAGSACLAGVTAPTLLLVGGRDSEVLALNRAAQACIGPAATLEVIPGASHLFEEPGALEQVAERVAGWLQSLPLAQERVSG